MIPTTTTTHVPAVFRINSHSNLSDIVENFKTAPPVKNTKQKGVQTWERNLWMRYHTDQMKMNAKKAAGPNLTLYEIKTGKKDKRAERIILSLYTYFVGVAFLFFLSSLR
jgi:hypothetical protein